MKKTNFLKLLMTFLLLAFFPTVMLGQVNIGSTDTPKIYSVLEVSTSTIKGGVRMPQLTTAERDAISTPQFVSDSEAKGLTIYNSTTDCIEYWNKTKWVSLCQGQLEVSFNPALNPSFPKEGGENGPYTPVEKFPCTGQTPYTYTIITGSEYTAIDVVDQNSGAFKVVMTLNTKATSRMAIVRITNNCSGESKEFLFSQDGNDELCNSAANPNVSVSNGGVLCAGGAVYMHITNASDSGIYIWTINDIEQGRGATFTALVPGVYKVYVGAIGCSNVSNAITVSSSSTTAPNNPIGLTASNNGVICSSATVTLTALKVPSTGTITWYKNGVKTSKTGNPISLSASETGSWFAVMEQGSCTSLPSQAIEITADNTSTPLTNPEVYVNGKPLATVTNFCINGRIELSLNNYASYTTGVTVKWFNGLTFLGEGERLSITTPSGTDFVLRCVVSDNVGVFCSSELFENKALTGVSPERPTIVSNPASICGGTDAQLTATVVNGAPTNTFQWYKDGVAMSGEVAQTLTATQTGSYQVEVITAGGCISTLSLPIVIGLSDFPELTWKSSHAAVEPGQVKVYQVAATFTPTTYNWIVDGNAVIQNGQGTNTVSILFPTTPGPVTIAVTGTNDCGISGELKENVAVAPSCSPIEIRNASLVPADGNTTAGNTITMSVTAIGSNPITYQWYRNGIAISGATSSTYTKSNAQEGDSGTYNCEVSNSCTPTPVSRNLGAITVTDLNKYATGTGTFSGATCFDVAVSDGGPQCGALAGRQGQKADFVKTYIYTFTNKGTGNKNLKFIIDDFQGAVVSATPQSNIPVTLGDGAKYTITVKYKEALMTTAIPTPMEVKIHAAFETGANVKTKSTIKITIKDCQCCGAFVAPGEWKNFMCHNLGADETLNPLVPVKEIFGNYYQFGRTAVIATSDTPAAQTIPGVSTGAVVPPTATWNDNFKTDGDPCPNGYRVPTVSQMRALEKYNGTPVQIGSWAVSATNFSSGFLFGKTIFLPNNSFRNASLNGVLGGGTSDPYAQRGSAGKYWTSSSSGGIYWQQKTTGGFSITNGYGHKNSGYSIRCIEE